MFPAFYSAPQVGHTGKWAAEDRSAAHPPPKTEESGFGSSSASGGPSFRKCHSQRPQGTNGGASCKSCAQSPQGNGLWAHEAGTRGQQTGASTHLCVDRVEAKTPRGIHNVCELDCG